MNRELGNRLLLACLVGFAILPFVPILDAGWVSDDFVWLHHAADTGLSGVIDGFPTQPRRFFRPLVTAVFWLVYSIGGQSPEVFRILALGLHVGCVLSLFRLIKGWTSVYSAVMAAATFAVLRSHCETVCWASSVGDLMATLSTLLAVNLALESTNDGHGGRAARVSSFVLTGIACASKEIGMAAGVIVPLAVALRQHGARRARHQLWLIVYPAVALAFMFWRWSILDGLGGYALESPSVLRWAWGIARGLLLMVLPMANDGLATFIATEPVQSRPLLMLTSLAFFAVGGWVLLRRRGLALLGWSWTAVGILPLGWLPFAERYAYLPSVGIVLILGDLLTEVKPPVLRRAMTSALTIFCIISAVSLVNGALKWRAAGVVAERLIAQTDRLIRSSTHDDIDIVTVTLPDTVSGKFCLRNGFGDALLLRSPQKEITWHPVAGHRVRLLEEDHIEVHISCDPKLAEVVAIGPSTAFVFVGEDLASDGFARGGVVVWGIDRKNSTPWLASRFQFRIEEKLAQRSPLVILGHSVGDLEILCPSD